MKDYWKDELMVPKKETLMAEPMVNLRAARWVGPRAARWVGKMGKQMVGRWVVLRAIQKADYLEKHLAKPMACYWETQREWKMVALTD